MEFHLLLLSSLFSLVLATTNASLSAEEYWDSALPNTTFPKALQQVLLQSHHGTFQDDDMAVFSGRADKKHEKKYKKRYDKHYDEHLDLVGAKQSMEANHMKREDTFLDDGMVFNGRDDKKYEKKYQKRYDKHYDEHSIGAKESMEVMKDTFLDDGMIFSGRDDKKYEKKYQKRYDKRYGEHRDPVGAQESVKVMKRKDTFLDDGMVFNSRDDKKYEKKYQKRYDKRYDEHRDSVGAKESMEVMNRKDTFLDDGMVFNSREDKKYEKKYQKRYDKRYDEHHDSVGAKESMEDMKQKDTFLDSGMVFNSREDKKYEKKYQKRYDKHYDEHHDSVGAKESMEDMKQEDTFLYGGMVFKARDDKKYEKKYQKRYDKRYDEHHDSVGAKKSMEDMKREDTFLDDGMVFSSKDDKKYEKKYQKRYDKRYGEHHDSVGAQESMEDKESNSRVSESDMVSETAQTVVEEEKDDLSSSTAVTLFYLYNDLRPGRRMTLLFDNAGNRAGFLPREISKSIPFSSDRIQEVFDHFSVKPKSTEAEFIMDVIEECESPSMKGEEKCCPTSFESLIDFVVARVDRNFKVVSTQSGKRQEYVVLEAAKKIGDEAVVCHKEVYPYAVYYCHEINGTEVHTVPLLGADGTRVEAVTICHTDTSVWSPEHKSFELLKVKPGVPICHFLANDTLVWVQAKSNPGHEFM